jgi:hypothetical protein
MRKVVFLVVAMAAGWYVKEHMNAGDHHERMAEFSLPAMGIGQGEGFLAMVSALLHGHGQTRQDGATKPASSPVVSTPSSPTGSPTSGGTTAAGFSKGPDLTIPPELLKFVNPSLLTTTPGGTQDLSPAARLALQQIISQARANPTAFREQYGAMAKTMRGQQ